MAKKLLALITGGTSGIGFAISSQLVSEYDIAISYASNDDKAKSAKEKLESIASGKVGVYCHKMSDFSDCKNLVDKISGDFSVSPSILVNCAGRTRDGFFLGTDFDRHFEMIQEHLIVTMGLIHLLLKDMYQKKFGRIINLSSIVSQFVKKGQTSYAAAKGGIESFTKALALEVAHRGITVNAIAPGLIETDMTKSLISKIKEKNINLRSKIPVGYVGHPDDIGRMACFLCQKDSHYITGQVFKIDGGRSLGDNQ